MTVGVVTPAKGARFRAHLFSVPRKDSDRVRVILDLSPLNKYIQCPTFRMVTTADVRRTLPQHGYTVQAVTQLRLKDVNILAYLDDLLVWTDTAQMLKKDTPDHSRLSQVSRLDHQPCQVKARTSTKVPIPRSRVGPGELHGLCS